MQIFFCITGYLFFDRIIKTDNKIDWTAFFNSRVRRIMPLYYVSCVLVVGIAWAVYGKMRFTKADLLTVAGILTFSFVDSSMKIGDFNLAPLNAVIWTLVHEWRFYCVLPLIGLAYTKKYGAYVLAVAAGVAIVDYVNLGKEGVVCWAYFLTGICSAILTSKVNAVGMKLKFALAALSTASFVLTCGTTLNGYGYQRFILSSLLFVSVVVCNFKLFHARPLKYLGEISYSVYLLHLPIFFVAFKMVSSFVDLGKLSEVGFWSIVVAVVPIVMVSCSMSYRHIEYPFLAKKQEKSQREMTVRMAG